MTASIKAKGPEGGGGFYTAYATIRRFDTHYQTAAHARKSEPLKEIYWFASSIFSSRYCVYAPCPPRGSDHQSQLR